jgi:hypothetical protein
MRKNYLKTINPTPLVIASDSSPVLQESMAELNSEQDLRNLVKLNLIIGNVRKNAQTANKALAKNVRKDYSPI